MEKKNKSTMTKTHWIRERDRYEICATNFICSECRYELPNIDMTEDAILEEFKFCPFCGKQMDKETIEVHYI